jgi:16S rRNA (uracil1498-N3)-methyltransferase
LYEDGQNRIYILCDESGKGEKSSIILSKIAENLQNNNLINKIEFVVIIGPEGGFTEKEFNRIYQLNNSYSISMGPRILRSDTAIISALTLIQEFLGDFNLKPNF